MTGVQTCALPISKSITLEEYAIDDTTKELRGFRVPFSDGEFPLDT